MDRHKVPWSKLYNKIELNLKHNKSSIDVYDKLWGTNMKTLIENSIELNGEHRTSGCPPGMGSNSPCKLGTLTSESFS